MPRTSVLGNQKGVAMNNVAALVAGKIRLMDEELKYFKGFLEWYLATKDKGYRDHQEFNDQYKGTIPKGFKTE